jgi:hypothetical protein
MRHSPTGDLYPRTPDGKFLLEDVPITETWEAMEVPTGTNVYNRYKERHRYRHREANADGEGLHVHGLQRLVESGLVRAIGVSNFSIKHLQEILDGTSLQRSFTGSLLLSEITLIVSVASSCLAFTLMSWQMG